MRDDSLLCSWKKALASLSDGALIERTRSYAGSERAQTAWLVAHLAEVFRRDLALKRGHPSVYQYARSELGLSDRQAWERVCAARLSLELPETPEKLASGELTLCKATDLWRTLESSHKTPAPAVARVEASLPLPAPVVTPSKAPTISEKRELLGRILGKSRRESEATLQGWKSERTGVPATARARPHATRRPDGPWTELGFSLSDEELGDWDRLRDLLSQKLGTRDPQAVLQWLVRLGLEKVDPVRQEARQKARRQKSADRASQAAKESDRADEKSDAPFMRVAETVCQERRKISAPARRRVWIRSGGRCRFVSPATGHKCSSAAFLDIDHVIPLCQGGTDDESNLTLACALHNRRRPFWKPEHQPLYAALLRVPDVAGETAPTIRPPS